MQHFHALNVDYQVEGIRFTGLPFTASIMLHLTYLSFFLTCFCLLPDLLLLQISVFFFCLRIPLTCSYCSYYIFSSNLLLWNDLCKQLSKISVFKHYPITSEFAFLFFTYFYFYFFIKSIEMTVKQTDNVLICLNCHWNQSTFSLCNSTVGPLRQLKNILVYFLDFLNKKQNLINVICNNDLM